MNVICPHACASFPNWGDIHSFLDSMVALTATVGIVRIQFPIGQSSATSDTLGLLMEHIHHSYDNQTYELDVTYKRDGYDRMQLTLVVTFNGGEEE
jgi:hypothetical protein